MGKKDTRADGVRSAGQDPPFSVILRIVMTVPAFDDVEGPMYRLLLTGWLDEHVDVWPEKKGHVLYGHAPIAASSRSEAMDKGRRLAESSLALCPPGSVIAQVQSIDWSAADPAEGTEFWDQEEPPAPDALEPG